MSPYEQNILDFYKIHEEHPELFTDDDRASLEALKAIFSEEDSIEKISDALALWCEEHPHILNVLLELPPSDSGERGPGSRKPRLTPKEARDLLDNIIRRSKLDDSQNSPPQSPQNPPPQP